MAHEEVDEVDRELVAHDGLVDAHEEALEGDEEHRHHQEVEQEPVEAEVVGPRDRALDGDVPAAEQHGGDRERQTHETEHLVPPQHDAEQRPRPEARQDHGFDQAANEAHRVHGAKPGVVSCAGKSRQRTAPEAHRVPSTIDADPLSQPDPNARDSSFTARTPSM